MHTLHVFTLATCAVVLRALNAFQLDNSSLKCLLEQLNIVRVWCPGSSVITLRDMFTKRYWGVMRKTS